MSTPKQADPEIQFCESQLRRPTGVTLLTVLTGQLSCLLLAAYVVLLAHWEENNQWAKDRRMSPPMFWGLIGLGVVMSFVATIGMWRVKRWGWWIACCGMVMFTIQNFGEAASVIFSGGPPSFDKFLSLNFTKFALRAFVFAIATTYWLQLPVRRFYRVENVGPLKAIVIVAFVGISTTIVLTILLQLGYVFYVRYTR